jgi:UPF0271 protein
MKSVDLNADMGEGFGRYQCGDDEEILSLVTSANVACGFHAGHRITHVKPHGALANISETDRDVADCLARAVRSVDPALICLGPALSEQLRAAEALHLRTVSEIYADRGYSNDGTLAPRGTPGAMIEDPTEAANRVIEMMQAGAIVTLTGERIPTPIGSVCVHGDSPHAIETARCVRKALENAGITVSAFS